MYTHTYIHRTSVKTSNKDSVFAFSVYKSMFISPDQSLAVCSLWIGYGAPDTVLLLDGKSLHEPGIVFVLFRAGDILVRGTG